MRFVFIVIHLDTAVLAMSWTIFEDYEVLAQVNLSVKLSRTSFSSAT